jgi:transposase
VIRAFSPEQLCEALRGRVTAHHRFLLRQHLDTIDDLQRTVDLFDTQIAKRLEPFRARHELLVTIPGVRGTAAACILTEIGADMNRFPSVAHLLS